MGKINKEFVLSDSSVNSYGFRLLTSGYQINEFKPNPIGYYMHERELGVLVKWDNLQIDGDRVLGNPNINDSNPRASQTINEINSGFLNGASMGNIVALEMSDDPALKLPGQTGVTITKWYNRECSLVDVPGNFNALCLYDLKGNAIPMNLIAGISDYPEENLDVNELLKTAVKDKSITPEQSVNLAKQYKDDPKKLMNTLHDFGIQRINYLNGLSWDELDKNGLLPELKEKHLTGFEKKYFMEFGKHYKDPDEKNKIVKDVSLDRLIKYALEQGDVDQSLIDGWKRNFGHDEEKMKALVNGDINKGDRKLEAMSWDDLDKGGLLPRLKKRSFQIFKQKFKDKFGVDYKDNKP